MKLIYNLGGTFNSGGMERIVIAKANWLAEQGHEVIIVTTEQNGHPDFFKLSQGVRRIDLNIFYSSITKLNVVSKYFVRRRMIKQHRKKLTDVLMREKADIVISTFGNEISFLPKIKDGSHKIAEIHFSRWYRLQFNRKGILHFIDKYLTFADYRVVKHYEKFVCLTNEDKLNWGNIPNLCVIPNFIESNCSQKADLLSHQMIAVGRLTHQKGYSRMIKAWKIVNSVYPEWKLNIFGEGEFESQIRDLIQSSGLKDCIKLHKPTKEIEKEYLKNSSLVLSSRYEGLPLVILEAMSYGLPPIAFACQCGPRDIIEDGVNGILVENGNIESLAQAIIKVIESENLRKNLGANALIRIQDFSKETIMTKWLELFNSLMR